MGITRFNYGKVDNVPTMIESTPPQGQSNGWPQYMNCQRHIVHFTITEHGYSHLGTLSTSALCFKPSLSSLGTVAKYFSQFFFLFQRLASYLLTELLPVVVAWPDYSKVIDSGDSFLLTDTL